MILQPLHGQFQQRRRTYADVLILKEKSTRYVKVSTKESDFFDGHGHRTEQNKVVYYQTYKQPLALFV